VLAAESFDTLPGSPWTHAGTTSGYLKIDSNQLRGDVPEAAPTGFDQYQLRPPVTGDVLCVTFDAKIAIDTAAPPPGAVVTFVDIDAVDSAGNQALVAFGYGGGPGAVSPDGYVSPTFTAPTKSNGLLFNMSYPGLTLVMDTNALSMKLYNGVTPVSTTPILGPSFTPVSWTVSLGVHIVTAGTKAATVYIDNVVIR
jgi:hypothetical protein